MYFALKHENFSDLGDSKIICVLSCGHKETFRGRTWNFPKNVFPIMAWDTLLCAGAGFRADFHKWYLTVS